MRGAGPGRCERRQGCAGSGGLSEQTRSITKEEAAISWRRTTLAKPDLWAVLAQGSALGTKAALQSSGPLRATPWPPPSLPLVPEPCVPFPAVSPGALRSLRGGPASPGS